MPNDSYDENKTIEKLTKKNRPVHTGHRERLRARFDKDNEMETFADHEILEMELSLVIPRRDTNGLAHALIDHFGSLESVYRASAHELIKIKGMTTGAAYLLAMHMPIMRRTMTYADATLRCNTMNSTSDAIAYAHRFFIGRNTETFALFLIDKRGHVISETIRESSSPSYVSIEIEDIVHRALREGASSVVIAHNHPSGDVSPSDDDLQIAKDIYDALASVNVALYDSLIFHESRYFSMRVSGVLGSFMKASDRAKTAKGTRDERGGEENRFERTGRVSRRLQERPRSGRVKDDYPRRFRHSVCEGYEIGKRRFRRKTVHKQTRYSS